jgi:beta-glucosidase
VSKADGDDYKVEFDVSNTGNRDGEEVAQLYVTDEFASVVQPVIQLKHFLRVSIPQGATRHVSFMLTPDDLAITGADTKRKVEPGDFDILVGASSADIRLKTKITIK